MLLCVLALTHGVAAADDEPLRFGETGLYLGDTVLFDGPVSGAAYDPAQELVWFRSKGTLQVIDLRTTSSTPVTIVTRLPDEGAFAIDGVSKAGYLTTDDQWVLSYPSLTTGKKTRLAAMQTGDFGDNAEEDAQARARIKKAKVVGAKWLKTLAARKPREVPGYMINRPVKGKLTLPTTMTCDDEEVCGTATSLADSRFVVVVTSVEYMPGAMVKQCLLYDTMHKKFASPTTSGGWNEAEPEVGPCTGYHRSWDGKSYLVGAYRCTLGATITCEEGDGTYLGWAQKHSAP